MTGTCFSTFVDNDDVQLHVLDNGRTAASLPTVLAIPGMGEYADESRGCSTAR